MRNPFWRYEVVTVGPRRTPIFTVHRFWKRSSAEEQVTTLEKMTEGTPERGILGWEIHENHPLNEPWFWRVYLGVLFAAAVAMRITNYQPPRWVGYPLMVVALAIMLREAWKRRSPDQGK